MGKTKYESPVKAVAAPCQRVYDRLSDLRNLEAVRDRLPEDKVSGLEFDRDTVSVEAAGVGRLAMRIVDREEPKCVKFESVDSPVGFHLWVQMLPTGPDTSKIRLTLEADLNPFIRAMVGGKLKDGLDKMAEMMAMIPY